MNLVSWLLRPDCMKGSEVIARETVLCALMGSVEMSDGLHGLPVFPYPCLKWLLRDGDYRLFGSERQLDRFVLRYCWPQGGYKSGVKDCDDMELRMLNDVTDGSEDQGSDQSFTIFGIDYFSKIRQGGHAACIGLWRDGEIRAKIIQPDMVNQEGLAPFFSTSVEVEQAVCFYR